MILTATPLRVSLFGGGTDYPAFFEHTPGAVLGMAIKKFCYVGVKPLPIGQEAALEGKPLRYRVQYSHVDDCAEATQIKHPAVRAALKYLNIEDKLPLEFHCFSDLPGRAGLGGSSAFSVGLLLALRTMLNRPGTPHYTLTPGSAAALAAEATHLEQKVIAETVGCQDQVLTAHGGINMVTFQKDKFPQVSPLVVPASRAQALEEALFLVYSGTMRDAHVMAAKQIAAIPNHHAILCKMGSMAQVGAKILADPDRPLDMLGKMLDVAWHLKCLLCPEISNDNINALYKRGRAMGALGGKLLGAGGGGFFLFYVPEGRRTKFVEGINAPWCQFQVSPHGSHVVINNGH